MMNNKNAHANNKPKRPPVAHPSATDEAHGVTCSWRMRPKAANFNKLRLIHKMNAFKDDQSAQQALILVKNLDEEKFVHMLASSLMLGRESILKMINLVEHGNGNKKVMNNSVDGTGKGTPRNVRTTPNSNRMNSGNKTKTKQKLHIMVKLWKPTLMLESTVPKAESQRGYHNSINNNSFDLNSSNNSGNGKVNGRKIVDNSYSNNSTGYLNTNAQYMDVIGCPDRIFLYEKGSAMRPGFKGKDVLVEETPTEGMVEYTDSDVEAGYDSDKAKEAPARNQKSNGNGNGSGAPSASAAHASTRPTLCIEWSITYLMDATGTLHVKSSVDTSRLSTPLPRVGLQLQLNKKMFETVMWQGQGPHECYTDRKGSNILATHAAPALALGVPYIVPCENGNRTDVSWLELLGQHGSLPTENSRTLETGAISADTAKITISPTHSTIHVDSLGYENTGTTGTSTSPSQVALQQQQIQQQQYGKPVSLRVDCSKRFNFSLQEYCTEDLQAALHSTSLEAFPRPFLSLNIDPYLMGVGGDDSWTASVHDEHLLDPEETYSFDLAMSFR